jgi:hypothetical protein
MHGGALKRFMGRTAFLWETPNFITCHNQTTKLMGDQTRQTKK